MKHMQQHKPDFSSVEAIEKWLLSIPKFSDNGIAAVNFQLERMVRFCEVLGNPQNDYKTVHVAGTNGKGTVSRMLASVYQSAGYQTGLYTSPHLTDLKERFCVNAAKMKGSMLHEFFAFAGEHILDNEYTFFEITTAIAFWYFKRMNVDIAVIETGLGGRLDATNVIYPEVSVITSISMDHMDVLGETISKIAAEKAGIIKNEIPVIIGTLPPEAEEVVRTVAKERSSPYLSITAESGETANENIFLSGEEIRNAMGIDSTWIEMRNAALVTEVVKSTLNRVPVSRQAILEGFRQLKNRFPRTAAFEKLSARQHWYFDGAHNREAIEVLIRQMRSISPLSEWTVVLSFMSDKLNESVAQPWQELNNVWIWPLTSGRAATKKMMLHHFPKGKIMNLSPDELFSEIDSKLVIFSGSFYFYPIVSEWIHSISAS